jgi:hypothetical protein
MSAPVGASLPLPWALPVLNNRQLVGIITERDFLPVTAHLLEARKRG